MTSTLSIPTVVDSIDPVFVYPEKPNRLKPGDEEEDKKKKKDPRVAEIEDNLKSKIVESQLTPKMKYKHPVTASQEIGWLDGRVVCLHKAIQQELPDPQSLILSRDSIRLCLLWNERIWSILQQE